MPSEDHSEPASAEGGALLPEQPHTSCRPMKVAMIAAYIYFPWTLVRPIRIGQHNTTLHCKNRKGRSGQIKRIDTEYHKIDCLALMRTAVSTCSHAQSRLT